MLAQVIISGLAVGLTYGMVAMGFVMLLKASRILNFAHGELAMFATFAGYLLVINLGMNYWLGVFVALLSGAALGVLVQVILIRPVEKQPIWVTVGVTFGLYLIIHQVAGTVFGNQAYPTPVGFPKVSFTILGASVSSLYLVAFGWAALVVIILTLLFRYTKFGIGVLATTQNKMAAQLMGINPQKVSMFAWGLGTLLGALGGIVLAPLLFLDINLMASALMNVFAAAVLGGIFSLGGTLVGGAILGVLQTIIGTYIDPKYPMVAAFMVIFIVLLVRPQGLFGGTSLRRV